MGAPLKILHLAPHMGGGVGSVVRALISESMKAGHLHLIGCLEEMNEITARWASTAGIVAADHLWKNKDGLNQLIRNADLVHLHWWHHPLLNALMHRRDLPPFRCAIWSHVNGLHAPQNIPEGIVDYADLLVLATPASLEIAHLRGNKKVRVIQSNSGPPAMRERARHTSPAFRIGYVGTVDAVKMHPDFVRISLEASIPAAKFIVAGGPKHEKLRREVAARGVDSRFEILGPVDDAGQLFMSFDVFGYPLCPWHYGTGEQVLIEAMAAGAVPVVLDNSCERHIVEHERTGLVCADTRDYPLALRRLHADRKLLATLSKQAREGSKERFAISGTVENWHLAYQELMETPCRSHALPGYDDALSLLLGALAGTDAGQAFSSIAGGASEGHPENLPPACFSMTRGSPFHYQKFFPDDPGIAQLCRTLSTILLHQEASA